MRSARVAIVGRPNVGKSTLVNRLAQTRDAIVHESEGVTRDRSYHMCEWNGKDFELIDTGGIDSLNSKDAFAGHIRQQALLACEEADIIVVLVDGTVALTDADEEVVRIVRRAKKPSLLVVNKIDNPSGDAHEWQYLSLGLGAPHLISSVHGYGTGDLLDKIVELLPSDDLLKPDQNALNIAIVGRPNVGKSSLTNRLVGHNRSIVSEIAGTTRDALDTQILWRGQKICLVDTAGMRKKNQVHEDIEYYSLVRGLRAMDRAAVCILVIDSTVGVTEQDQKLISLAVERGCGIVICLNKWDLMDSDEKKTQLTQSIQLRLSFAPWAALVKISALTGKSCDKALEAAVSAAEVRGAHFKTAIINRVLEQVRESGHTVTSKNRRLKVNYATQTGENPPVFTLFCNAPDLVDDNYRRFIERKLRVALPLEGTPIRLKFRRKDS